MQIPIKRLKEIIQEELKEVTSWDDDSDEALEALGPVHQLNDMLVSEAQHRIFLAADRAGRIGAGPGQITENDLAHAHEEPLMDHLLPIAKQFASTLWPSYIKHLEQYMSENVRTDEEESSFTGDVGELGGDEAFGVGYTAGKEGL